MSITIEFQFEIDQELNTPGGPGCIEAAGLFWRPDGGTQIRYLVELGRGREWFDEQELLKCNRRIVAGQLPLLAA